MKAYVADTETTGHKDAPECIELAYLQVELELESGGPKYLRPVGDFYEERFKPRIRSTYGALSVHHILAEELEGMAPSSEARLPGDAVYLIGHNIDYDWKVLGQPEVKRIDTLALARRYVKNTDSHRLAACLYAITPEEGHERLRDRLLQSHQAAADVELSMELLAWIINQPLERRLDGFESLWEISELARIPTHWTFGKHLGKRIEEADRGYLRWCTKQDSMDPYVKIAARRALGEE